MQGSGYTAFLSLVHFDQETNLLRTQVKELQQQLNELRNAHKKLEQERLYAQQEWHDARKEVDAQELEMKSLEDARMRKVQQMEAAASPKEYQALRKEVETIAQKQNEIEQRLVALWNTADVRKRAAEQRTKTAEHDQTTLDAAVTEKNRALQELEERIAVREKEWGNLTIGLPEDLLQKYIMMRTAINNPVVPLEDDSCSVCFHSLTRSELSVLRQEHLLQCKGCFRFVYRQQEQ